MKKIIAVCSIVFATAAYAYTITCTTHVVVQDGLLVTCQVCCNSVGVCTTQCR